MGASVREWPGEPPRPHLYQLKEQRPILCLFLPAGHWSVRPQARLGSQASGEFCGCTRALLPRSLLLPRSPKVCDPTWPVSP